MDINEAKNLVQNDFVFDDLGRKYKILSIKTWKRNPEKVLVSLRHGLFIFIKVDENEIHLIHTTNPKG